MSIGSQGDFGVWNGNGNFILFLRSVSVPWVTVSGMRHGFYFFSLFLLFSILILIFLLSFSSVGYDDLDRGLSCKVFAPGVLILILVVDFDFFQSSFLFFD